MYLEHIVQECSRHSPGTQLYPVSATWSSLRQCFCHCQSSSTPSTKPGAEQTSALMRFWLPRCFEIIRSSVSTLFSTLKWQCVFEKVKNSGNCALYQHVWSSSSLLTRKLIFSVQLWAFFSGTVLNIKGYWCCKVYDMIWSCLFSCPPTLHVLVFITRNTSSFSIKPQTLTLKL